LGSVNFQNGFQFGNGRLTSSGTIQTNNALDIFDSLGTTGQAGSTLSRSKFNGSARSQNKSHGLFPEVFAGNRCQEFGRSCVVYGGKVIVTGVNLTQTQAADLTKAFKEQFFRLSPKVSASVVLRQC